MNIGIQIAQIQHQSKLAMFEHLAALKSSTTKEKEASRLPENDRKNEKVLNLPDFSKIHDEEDVLTLIDLLNIRDGLITFEPYKFDAYA